MLYRVILKKKSMKVKENVASPDFASFHGLALGSGLIYSGARRRVGNYGAQEEQGNGDTPARRSKGEAEVRRSESLWCRSNHQGVRGRA
jgi:hypothetical protein